MPDRALYLSLKDFQMDLEVDLNALWQLYQPLQGGWCTETTMNTGFPMLSF